MAGGSQSLTTFAAGGDAWQAPEGTYTVPPTTEASVTMAYGSNECICSGSGSSDYGSGSDYYGEWPGSGSDYGEYGPGGGSEFFGSGSEFFGSGSDYFSSGSDYYEEYGSSSGSGSGCVCPGSDPCQGSASGNGECMCEEHGYNQNQCLQIGCCSFDNGECWSAVGSGQCSGSGAK